MTKKKREALYSIWSVMILIAIIAAIISVGYATFSKKNAPVSSPSTIDNSVPSDGTGDNGVQMLSTPALLTETEDAGNDYIGKMAFLCDTTTIGLRTYSLLPDGTETDKLISTSDAKISLSGISSVMIPSSNGEVTIADAVKNLNPEILVITLGIDGAAYLGQDYFKSSYTELVKSIKEASPSTTIICNSILPVSQNYANENSMNSDTIKQANNWIQDVANNNGCRYADSYSALVNPSGFIKSEYNSGDGITPNEAGLTAMINYLRTHSI